MYKKILVPKVHFFGIICSIFVLLGSAYLYQKGVEIKIIISLIVGFYSLLLLLFFILFYFKKMKWIKERKEEKKIEKELAEKINKVMKKRYDYKEGVEKAKKKLDEL